MSDKYIVLITKMNLRNDTYPYIVSYADGTACKFTQDQAEEYILLQLDYAYAKNTTNAIWAEAHRI